MTLLPFLLVSEPSTTPAEPAGAAAAQPNEGTAEGPEPGPIPAPVTARASSPRPPRFRGIGLMATAGVFGALGLGANIGRIVTVSTGCKDTAGDPQGCLTHAVSLVALSPVALISNITAFGLAGGAGSMHGRYLAHRTALAGGREPRTGLQIGLGAGLMTLGIVGYLGARVGSFIDGFGAVSCLERHPLDESGGLPPEYGGCLRGKWGGYLAGVMISQSAGIVGVGLLSHGATYRRKLRRLRERTDARVAPSLGPTYAGLSLSGRF